MTQVREPLTTSPRHGSPGGRPARVRRGNIPIVALLILSLVACGATQDWASNWKIANSGTRIQQATAQSERGALSGMNSYALALMLGGLRGPLVMALWSKVENQKIDRELEDVDTMIEWIRLLQPEFDTVHIFQMWNKAYNISVMMASTASKYQTILDAIDYGRRVEADRPGNLNILDELAQIFGDKLGGKNVSERHFYRRQFREDTLTDDNMKAAFPEDAGPRHHRLGIKFLGEANGPILDAHNNLDPSLTAAHYIRPSELPAGSEWNDGAELQYLRQYQPFDYGVSPTTMAYNYAKRAQVEMTVGGQRPLSVGETVIDSRPALFLKQWAEEEADRGITFEAQAFGIPHDAEAHALEDLTAGASKVVDPHALEVAIYSYGVSARVCPDALAEYKRHLANPQYINQFQTYASHQQEVGALQLISTADKLYLETLRPGADAARLKPAAAEAYTKARAGYEIMVLRYYTEEAIAQRLLPKNRNEIAAMPPEKVDELYRQMIEAVKLIPAEKRDFEDQRGEFGVYIARAAIRLQVMGYEQPSVLQK